MRNLCTSVKHKSSAISR